MTRTLSPLRPDAPPAPRSGDRVPAARPAARPALPYRRVVQGVLLGALVMLGVATVDTLAGATVPVLGTFAALPSGGDDARQVVEVPAPPSQPGTCLSWARPDAADAGVVDCGKPHLFEQAGSVALYDQPALPDDPQWRQLVADRCAPLVAHYLNGKFDPDGRYRVGALKPSAAKWREGDRELRCGLQSASQSGALYPTTGLVAANDQSDVEQPGTCLGINAKQIGDPVDCDQPHAVETVGVVDLGQKFPGGFPAVADQDAFLQPACAKAASTYAGGDKVITDKKLTVYWDNMTADSWKAGSRKVNCNLGALLPDRSGFAPVTGSVKGAVAVGDRPAPPATATPTPGAPASPPAPEPTTTTTAPPSPTSTETPTSPTSPSSPPPPPADDPSGVVLPDLTG